MLSGEIGFNTYIVSPRSENVEQLLNRVEEAIHYPLLERDDGVLGNRDELGANLTAARSDVAVPDIVLTLQVRNAVFGIQRVHLERRGVDQEARADELIVLMVVTQYVAHILTQKALDALAELLHAFDVRLLHAPRAIVRVRTPGLKPLDLLFDPEIPRDIGNQIANRRKGVHRFYDHRHIQVEIAQPRHTHQLRHAIDLGGTRSAL